MKKLLGRSIFVLCILFCCTACQPQNNAANLSTTTNTSPALSDPIQPDDFLNLSATKSTVQQTKKSVIPAFDQINSFYAYNASGYTYVGMQHVDWSKDQLQRWQENMPTLFSEFEEKVRDGLTAFRGLEPVSIKRSITDHELMFWTNDGVRHVYGTAPGGYVVMDGQTFLVPKSKLQEIQRLHKLILDEHMQDRSHTDFTRAYPQWLAWMTPSKIEKVVFYSPTRGALTIHPELTQIAAERTMQSVQPTSPKTYSLDSLDFSGKDIFHLKIYFDNGIEYTIYAKSAGGVDAYYVESSDMSYGCQYVLQLSSVHGAAAYLIEEFESLADAKSMQDVENPLT